MHFTERPVQRLSRDNIVGHAFRVNSLLTFHRQGSVQTARADDIQLPTASIWLGDGREGAGCRERVITVDFQGAFPDLQC